MRDAPRAAVGMAGGAGIGKVRLVHVGKPDDMAAVRRALRRGWVSSAALVLPLALNLAVPGVVRADDPEPGDGRSSYRLQAAFEASVHLAWRQRRVDVSTTIRLRNSSGGPVGRIHLNTLAARLGDMELLEVSVDGDRVDHAVRDQTLTLHLAEPLPEDGEAEVRVSYRATIGTSTAGRDHLWTMSGGVARLYRVIPWPSRRVSFGPSRHGEPFVTPASSALRVTLSASRPVVWATSGRRISRVDGREVVVLRDARDFAITASPAYGTLRGMSRDGQTRIIVHTIREDPHLWLRLARRELARFEERLGEYPYRTFRIAEIDRPTAMESAALVWLPRGRSRSNYAYLMAHETAHQWFYGIVGNDGERDAFADEAVADFLARHALGILRDSRCPRDRLDRSIHAYSHACYYETIYIQGGRFLDSLRRDFGAVAFWRALRAYLSDHRFEVAGSARLLEALRAQLGDGVLARYRKRFPSLYP